MSSESSDNGSDGADFDDWRSDAGDAPVQSLLEPTRTVPTAAAAWDELRAASGFDCAAFRRERGASSGTNVCPAPVERAPTTAHGSRSRTPACRSFRCRARRVRLCATRELCARCRARSKDCIR